MIKRGVSLHIFFRFRRHRLTRATSAGVAELRMTMLHRNMQQAEDFAKRLRTDRCKIAHPATVPSRR